MTLAAQTYLDTELPLAQDPAARVTVINDAIGMLPDWRLDIRVALHPYLRVPQGLWNLDGSVSINRPMTLDMPGAAFVQEDNEAPIVIFQENAWASTICNGTLIGANHTDHNAPGILAKAYGSRIHRMLIRETGVGVHLDGLGANNCNAWDMESVIVLASQGDGVITEGGDTNGGVARGLQLISCGGVGIRDNSFLGNYYFGTHWHTVAYEAYVCEVSANRSVFLGGYVEADCGHKLTPQGPAFVTQAQQTWAGGDPVHYVTVGDRIGARKSALGFYAKTPNGALSMQMPSGAVESVMAVTRFDQQGAGVETWDLRRVHTLKQWGIVTDGSGLTRPLSWTASDHAEGEGVAKVNAKHFNVGGPTAGLDIPEPE